MLGSILNEDMLAPPFSDLGMFFNYVGKSWPPRQGEQTVGHNSVKIFKIMESWETTRMGRLKLIMYLNSQNLKSTIGTSNIN